MGWTPPTALMCHSGGVDEHHLREASMGEANTIGLDLAKNVFQVHGADTSGAVLFRKKLRRHQVLTFFAGQPLCTVAMEACSSAHHWAREIGRLGHAVRPIPPAYVKPFVKRQKTMQRMRKQSARRPSVRPCASWCPRASRRKPPPSCSGRGISWSGSEPRSSMPCAATWPSSASWRRKDRLVFRNSCRLSKIQTSLSRSSLDQSSRC